MSAVGHRETRIVLVRHGRSAHVHSGWIDAEGFRSWRRVYEAAGIRDDENVPVALAELARGAECVFSSDAARAVESARLLAPARDIVVSPLLRELELEGPRLAGLRLPLAAWAVAVGGRTLLMTIRGRYPSPAEAARIDDASAWLGELAHSHSVIVAVTHASLRRQLARRLERAGWSAVPGRRSDRPWSDWQFVRTLDRNDGVSVDNAAQHYECH